jgi:hypothetical protein
MLAFRNHNTAKIVFNRYYHNKEPTGSGSLKISVADIFKPLICPRLKTRQQSTHFCRVIAARDRRLSNAPPGVDHCDLRK